MRAVWRAGAQSTTTNPPLARSPLDSSRQSGEDSTGREKPAKTARSAGPVRPCGRAKCVTFSAAVRVRALGPLPLPACHLRRGAVPVARRAAGERRRGRHRTRPSRGAEGRGSTWRPRRRFGAAAVRSSRRVHLLVLGRPPLPRRGGHARALRSWFWIWFLTGSQEFRIRLV
ncbi:hypothetical protein GQ55_9G491600 [Panicum hallii var. hallii]|uniref:Uncharacterized protein n=1 Tax=Panicum hallii var. hallii TaxID=1504633 RepID=A0A2T7CDF2_9POAL|nr:hypothetical protein GQ55_9G491600 [Panicum hallii var. hallii]